jgi:hypothetical protein
MPKIPIPEINPEAFQNDPFPAWTRYKPKLQEYMSSMAFWWTVLTDPEARFAHETNFTST